MFQMQFFLQMQKNVKVKSVIKIEHDKNAS